MDLNPEPILGSMGNVTKALRVIEVVENRRFDTLPEQCRWRGDYDTGSVCPDADYLYYNIFANRTVTENEAYSLIHLDHTSVPDGDPRWWDFQTVPDGWVGDNGIVSSLVDVSPGSWEEDIPTDNKAMDNNPESWNNNASAATPQNSGIANATAPGTGGNVDVNILCAFLQEVRITSETVNHVTCAKLRSYLRGRLNLQVVETFLYSGLL